MRGVGRQRMAWVANVLLARNRDRAWSQHPLAGARALAVGAVPAAQPHAAMCALAAGLHGGAGQLPTWVRPATGGGRATWVAQLVAPMPSRAHTPPMAATSGEGAVGAGAPTPSSSAAAIVSIPAVLRRRPLRLAVRLASQPLGPEAAAASAGPSSRLYWCRSVLSRACACLLGASAASSSQGAGEISHGAAAAADAAACGGGNSWSAPCSWASAASICLNWAAPVSEASDWKNVFIDAPTVGRQRACSGRECARTLTCDAGTMAWASSHPGRARGTCKIRSLTSVDHSCQMPAHAGWHRDVQLMQLKCIM